MSDAFFHLYKKVGWSVHPIIHPLVRETRGEIKTKQTGDSKRSIEGKIY